MQKFIPVPLSKKRLDKIYDLLGKRYNNKIDPWGFDLKKSRLAMKWSWPIYKHYFRTRIIGKEKIKDQQFIVISNHTGQIPIDAGIISCAFLSEVEPPRVLRPMVERFVGKIPFFGRFAFENGAVLGDRANAYHLLNEGESILVFPEGVRGITKSTQDYYKTQEFTRGFFRLALRAKVDILPIAVVGAEEFYPYVYQAKKIARMFGLPSLPITPFFPWLGPFGIMPMPSPVDILIGEPYPIPKELSPDAADSVIDEHVYSIENTVKELVDYGNKNRRRFWGSEFLSSSKSRGTR